MLRLTINRFVLVLFLLTSLLPIIVLAFMHLSFLDQTLNNNEPFLKLIEHEEFVLFCIYLTIVIISMSIGIFCFKLLISEPIEKLINKMELLSNNFYPSPLESESIFHEVKIIINKFNEMLGSLQKADAKKKEFISSLSHDIKIPLLAEQKALELLGDYNLSTEQFIKLNRNLIHNNTILLHLVNTLLDLYKLEEQDLELSKELFCLNTLLKDISESLYPLVKEKGIIFVLPSDNSVFIHADRLQFQRVFNNILMNAIENSYPESKIEIRVKEDETGINIDIENQGKAIEKNLLDSIFDKYSSYSTGKVGLGLGLYISSLIIKKHKGSIKASSDEKYTVFSIVIKDC